MRHTRPQTGGRVRARSFTADSEAEVPVLAVEIRRARDLLHQDQVGRLDGWSWPDE